MSDQDSSEIDIAEFIDKNANLFVVLGVFSALAIYISQLQEGPLINSPLETRVGFAGSLLLALLILSLIYKQLVGKVGSYENLIRAHTRLANLDLIIFTTGVGLLIPALANPLIQYQNALYYTTGSIGIVFSLPFIFVIALKLSEILPESGYIRQILIIILGAISARAGRPLVEYIRSGSVPIGTREFSLTNPWPVLFDVLALDIVLIQIIGISSIVFAVLKIIDLFEKRNDDAENDS